MKLNDVIHGFRVTAVRPLAELEATMVEMVYEKNGAKLIWLDREDPNKTYAISFKTIPENDTGVFHILEHSVLNGSDKFPLREPFVDLLKSSMQTFLNALTFPDKTVYPVSSRNNKDFYNLVNVYTDAVLHPAIYYRPETFQQEGWHYEWNGEKLSVSGVVYNEMKGVYNSPDAHLGTALERLLYPDCCYGCVSGGYPEHIPELTYEKFLDTHRKYYHPSNARIFLDGSVDTDEILGLLDSYLKDYEKEDMAFHVGEQPAVAPPEFRGKYAISEEEEETGRDLYGFGFVYGTFRDIKKSFAMQVLSDVLCGSNDSPLCKAVQDTGLCENISFDADDGTKFLMGSITAKNTDRAKLPELKQAIRSTLEELADKGLDKDQLVASVNALEFSMRERDFGPKGVVYAVTALNTWLYDGDPADSLVFGSVFDDLRADIEKGYFEQLLREAVLDNPHHASAFLEASRTYGAEKQARQDAELQALADSWSEEKKAQTAEENRHLAELQQTPDSPETSAKLPKLTLADVPEKGEELNGRVSEADGAVLVQSSVNANGILYGDLYFDISDFTAEELSCASFLSELYGEAGTETHSSMEIQAMLKKDLGSFSCNVDSMMKVGQPMSCRPFFTVTLSALQSKCGQAVPLTEEVLFHTVFRDKQLLSTLLKQRKQSMKEGFQSSGNRYGANRVEACFTPRAAFAEYTAGLDYYRWVCRTEQEFEKDSDALIARMETLAGRIFTRDRLTLGVTGTASDSWVRDMIGLFPVTGIRPTECLLRPLGLRKEGILIPAEVGFAVKGMNLFALGMDYTGQMSVASSLLSFDYLWNEIRVQNGAYGAGMSMVSTGSVRFTTFRDPAVAHSLQCFDAAGRYLQEHVPEQKALESLIIGAVGEAEPVRSARSQGKFEIRYAMSGITTEYLTKLRREKLKTDGESLIRIGRQLEEIAAASAVCVIAGKEQLKSCGDAVTDLITLG